MARTVVSETTFDMAVHAVLVRGATPAASCTSADTTSTPPLKQLHQTALRCTHSRWRDPLRLVPVV